MQNNALPEDVQVNPTLFMNYGVYTLIIKYWKTLPGRNDFWGDLVNNLYITT